MFDVIVIGGGPGGYAAAEYAAHHGYAVALVERDRLGGTCLNRGCIPTKAYLHTAEVANAAQTYAPEVLSRFDRKAMLDKKNEIVDTLVKGIGMLMKAGKITVIDGFGRLMNAQAPFFVQVNRNDGAVETLEGEHVLIATGSEPARLPVPGCDRPEVWTSDDILGEAGAEPFQTLLIIGGGVIGVEMACIYAKLGVSVTILEAEKRCLPMLDVELGRSAEAMLKGLGVALFTDACLQRIAGTTGHFTVTYEKNGAEAEHSAEGVLLATGRKPVTEGLFSQNVAMEWNRRFIKVDERFQTSLPNVYAIGDVNGVFQLAHAAHAQGLAAVSDMLGIPAPINAMLIPSCVYTTPEIASIGITADEAKAQGLDVVVGKALTTQNARTLIEGLGRGFIKLVFSRATHQLLGAQLFCGRATDLVGELTMAMESGLTAEAMLRPLRAHPTFEEAVTDAVAAAKFE